MTYDDLNCTVVTALYNLDRENWTDYKRPWQEYLDYFKNTLSLKCKFVIYVDPDLVDFVIEHRQKIDQDLKYTKIIAKKFSELPKFYLRDKIQSVMLSPEYKNGLSDPNPPEYNNPNYIILIHSKMFLVEEAIKYDFYKTEYYMWLDGGILHRKFNSENIGRFYPDPKKIFNVNGIRILCRFQPQESDLDIKKFYKSHQNRFGAGVILGKKIDIINFNI